MPIKKVSIIIPVYNRLEWIGRSLEALAKQTYEGKFEVIVVDDGSDDKLGAKSLLTKYDSNLEIKYFYINHRGPAAARNYATAQAEGEILIFIDDDSLPVYNWLYEITGPFYCDHNVSLVNGKTLSLYQDKDSLAFRLEKYVYPGKSWATSNIAYTKASFTKLGGFDENFKLPSWEDNDLGLRARWAGMVHIYNNKAIVYHPHENSIPEYRRKCYLNGRGAFTFSKKYLFKKPLWAIGTPFIMCRYLTYIISVDVLTKDIYSKSYLRFLWSVYSAKGFWDSLLKIKYANH